MKQFIHLIEILVICISLISCSSLRSLRQQAYRDEALSMESEAHQARYESKNKKFDKRRMDPVTVLDKNLSKVQGSPVDLSGIRAKHGKVTKGDFERLNALSENSLWREDGQNNYLFAKNNLSAPGDLVSIQIETDLKKDIVHKIKKTLPEEDAELLAIPGYLDRDKSTVAGANANQGREPASNNPASNNESNPEAANAGASSVAANSEEKISAEPAFMTGEILQRYPNGNVLVRAMKRLPAGDSFRDAEVTGIVKGSDIAENMSVKSSQFFEWKVEVYK